MHEFETYQSEFSNVLSIRQQKQQAAAFSSPSKRTVEDDPDSNLKPEVMSAIVSYAQLDKDPSAANSDSDAAKSSAAVPMDQDGIDLISIPASIDEAMRSLLREIDELQQKGTSDERSKTEALVHSYSTRHPLIAQMLSDLL